MKAMRFKTKRSAGVPVTAEVHRLIAQGNAARGRDWIATADAYLAALALDPSLYHIQIQLGHAAKEADRPEQAKSAYLTAARLRKDTGEPFLHLGHLATRQGTPVEPSRYYAEAAKHEDTAEQAIPEFLASIGRVASLDGFILRRVLTEPEADRTPAPDMFADPIDIPHTAAALQALMETLTDPADRTVLENAHDRLLRLEDHQVSAPPTRSDRPLVFDLTDLVAHFRNHRLPTGIQRVQIEVVSTAIQTQGRDHVHICCFTDGRDDWIGIPIDRFLTIAYLASTGGDIADDSWAEARARLFLGLAINPHFEMPQRAVLVNLGTSWWIYDYFRMVREAKEQAGISYVPFVHDWIPIMVPEHVVKGVIEDFVSWTVGVFTHADAFLVNSVSTGVDLRRVAKRLGHQVEEERIEVVPLDADFRHLSDERLPVSALARWNLGNEPFALFVSTIESRKNHVLAFEGWVELIRRHGSTGVPRLVCVGRDGWLNDRAFAKLGDNARLRAAVTIIHQVSDQELALLYRSCRFTVYPSHYEGWGLPITESLCYGRVPVVANNSSLPEAAAGMAVLFTSNSVSAFVQAVEQVALDAVWRADREALIAAKFRPRSWTQIANQINAAVDRFALTDDQQIRKAVARPVRLGTYYPLALYKEARLWPGIASGEIYRAGDGWLWPETTGCRTRPEGGELRMDVEGPATQLRLYLRLRGLEAQACSFIVTVAGQTIAEGSLKAGQTRWASGDLPEGIGKSVSILVRGTAEETIVMSTGGSDKRLRAGPAVLGFALCSATDEDQRSTFVATAAFGDIEEVSAYRDKRALIA